MKHDERLQEDKAISQQTYTTNLVSRLSETKMQHWARFVDSLAAATKKKVSMDDLCL
jgi:hypothetical protein